MVEDSNIKPTKLIWLVPIFMGLLGGILAYIALKDYSQEKANDAIYYSVVSTFILIGIYVVIFLAWQRALPIAGMS